MSYRDETIAIISIAQQARPKVSGQIELPCAQATAFSTVVSISLSSSSPSSVSNTPGPFPCQRTRSLFRPYSPRRFLLRGRPLPHERGRGRGGTGGFPHP